MTDNTLEVYTSENNPRLSDTCVNGSGLLQALAITSWRPEFHKNANTPTHKHVIIWLQSLHRWKAGVWRSAVTFPSILAYRRPWPGYILYPLKLHNSTLKTTNTRGHRDIVVHICGTCGYRHQNVYAILRMVFDVIPSTHFMAATRGRKTGKDDDEDGSRLRL